MSLAALPLVGRAATAAGVPAAVTGARDWPALEAASGGRLGVTLLETASGHRVGHRQDERFPMCSTFKTVLTATVLARADDGSLSLDRRLPVGAGDIVSHSPDTTRHVGKDMTVRDLCRTTMVTSDNAAANLLLGVVGGPPGVTAWLRGIGDTVTRNDRLEPEMNRFSFDDPRDTTSPAAMAATLQRILLGDALSSASRQQLADWLIDNDTGRDCIRAGVDGRWRVGEKTGSNGVDTRNDIGVLWPLAGGAPWVLTCYLQGAAGIDSAARDAVLARAAALAQQAIDAA
ncbi:beta-lactamase class A [Luteimonas sp. 3794]|nr:beta-lactamase class A [Luteimonas sp. 3794]